MRVIQSENSKVSIHVLWKNNLLRVFFFFGKGHKSRICLNFWHKVLLFPMAVVFCVGSFSMGFFPGIFQRLRPLTEISDWLCKFLVTKLMIILCVYLKHLSKDVCQLLFSCVIPIKNITPCVKNKVNEWNDWHLLDDE